MRSLIQSDINAFFCLVTQRVVASPNVGVPNPEFKSISEIMSEIECREPQLLSLLNAFFAAYQIWHDLHVELEISGIAGSLSSEQNADLQAAIEARDTTRDKLLAAIAA